MMFLLFCLSEIKKYFILEAIFNFVYGNSCNITIDVKKDECNTNITVMIFVYEITKKL